MMMMEKMIVAADGDNEGEGDNWIAATAKFPNRSSCHKTATSD